MFYLMEVVGRGLLAECWWGIFWETRVVERNGRRDVVERRQHAMIFHRKGMRYDDMRAIQHES